MSEVNISQNQSHLDVQNVTLTIETSHKGFFFKFTTYMYNIHKIDIHIILCR